MILEPADASGHSPLGEDHLEPLVLDPCTAGGHLDAWRKLSVSALDPNPFFGPDFLIPFLENTGRSGVRLFVIRCGRTGDWLMAAPMGRRRLGLAVSAASSWATEYGPLGTPLLSVEAPQSVPAAFLALTAEKTRLPLIAFHYLPFESATARAIEDTGNWSFRRGPVSMRASHAAGPEGEAQFAKAFSGKRRKELPRLIRRLSQEGEVRFESHSGDDVPRYFESFLQLEASGWKGTRGTALLSHQNTARFAREMIAKLSASGCVRIDTISVSGKPIAMLIIMLDAGRAFSWKIAFDESYARFSPGAQITLFALERNLQDPAITCGDSLAVPGHPMIEPLWRGRLSYGTLLCARSVPGRALQMAAKYDMALEGDIRRVARKLLRRAG
ncbi:GNAT family N-acetyltransferase [Roseibium polysiphoniae]|uniref:GNAT family N-acetyltransferase n=1 Tax=Roseibium polysiphoniae TaxID=2571221 RepID=A0ABR9CBT1_9HYPH|nr:GNAT family N-acetyltransferase [Roseibium polysiphoniae]